MAKQKRAKITPPSTQATKAASQISTQATGAIPEAQLLLREQHHRGPLPTPADFRGYDIVVPGAGERILKMAENQNDHVIEMGKEVELHRHDEFKRGQKLAFALGIFGILGATVLGVSGGYGLYIGIGLGLVGLASMMSHLFNKQRN